jgi:hypothetical protein
MHKEEQPKKNVHLSQSSRRCILPYSLLRVEKKSSEVIAHRGALLKKVDRNNLTVQLAFVQSKVVYQTQIIKMAMDLT